MAKRELNVTKKKSAVKWEFPLEKNNLIIIGIGLAVILLGYMLMATGISDEIGYTVIIPYGIIKRFNKVEVQ